MAPLPTGSDGELTTDEKRERIEAWYWHPDVKLGSATFNFFAKMLYEVDREIDSENIRETFARTSPEQIDRLWKQYLLAQIVS